MRCLPLAVVLAAAGCSGSGGDSAADAGPAPPGFASPGDRSLGDELGSAVVEANNEILVGVPGDDGPPLEDGSDPAGLERSGAVLVLDATTLEPLVELRAATPQRGARFGASLAVAGDILAVGAPGDFDPDPEAEVRDATGAVHLFARDPSGWTPLGEPLIPEGARVGDRFGYSVSLAGDRLIAGAPGDDRGGDSTGGIYIFVRSGDQFVPSAQSSAAARSTAR